jgi:hypothetical protein
MLATGDRFGRYEILGELNAGAMGASQNQRCICGAGVSPAHRELKTSDD